MDWDERYRNGEAFWDKGAPAMKQYLARQTVRGRALVPGCGRWHEVVLAVEHGLDAAGLDIAPGAINGDILDFWLRGALDTDYRLIDCCLE
ncbi:MAG: hypothetical protein ABIP05_13210 [Nitrospiraceae bacterium]